jgi:hypothetical protein
VLPAPIAAVQDKLLQQPKGDRAFVEMRLALRAHGSEWVSVACARTVSAAVVLNHVHRLKAPPAVSEHPRLAGEPQADGARRDQLRGRARGAEACVSNSPHSRSRGAWTPWPAPCRSCWQNAREALPGPDG